jgi:hypothetical protein
LPIVFVHGVAQRDEHAFEGLKVFLSTYVAPAVRPDDPTAVQVYGAFWGPLGAEFAWGGLSRPRSAITGQGARDDVTLAPTVVGLTGGVAPQADAAARRPAQQSGLAGGAQESPGNTLSGSPDARSDLIFNALIAETPSSGGSASAVFGDLDADLARKIVALDEAARAAGADDVETILADAAQRLGGGAAAQGGVPKIFGPLQDRVEESLSRASDSGFFVASRVLEELRRPLNDLVTVFTGDVFVYLSQRIASNNAVVLKPDANAVARRTARAGAIPESVLRVLKRAVAERTDPDEPLVVLSHSMGGQIVYDIVTYFLPMLAEQQPEEYGGLRIDFWAAAASQVALFEEMKLFLASSPEYSAAKCRNVPYPDRRYLGPWWNVWDRNDYISYTAADIFDGVMDYEYVSGRSILGAHGGYLMRPSFFRLFAKHVDTARATRFGRS